MGLAQQVTRRIGEVEAADVPSGEPAPAERPPPAEKPAPVEEPPPAEKPAPAEEPPPAEKPAPAEEPPPAEKVPPAKALAFLESLLGRPAPGVHIELRAPKTPYALATVVFVIAVLTGVVILSIGHFTTHATKASFQNFFSSAAQVLVGLLIALAIQVRADGLVSHEGEARFEVALATTWIVLGQALSLAALLPDCPAFVVSVAAAVVPASIVGALAAIVALVVATD